MMRKQLLLGLVFGFCFGFLLQKGGVAKFDVLIGVLLLEDFTVIKVMLSAILVGMIGVWSLHGLGLVTLHVKPTRYAANITGGLIFGAGFALAAYCPGTGAAALGQGNFDALAVMLGMVVGAYVFAAMPKFTARVSQQGNRGQLTLPELFRVRHRPFIAGFAAILVLALVGLAGLPE
jgi:uncharacterized membrane protein YedE/YeeE